MTRTGTAIDRRLEIELAAGVVFPDWSVVTSKKAGAALADVCEAFGVEGRWTGMEDDEDRMRRAILTEYGATGRAPTAGDLMKISGDGLDELYTILGRLKRRDMVVLDEGGKKIIGAYPFTERDTGHRITLRGADLNAMCAIDALGAGAMYGTDTVIRSFCGNCGGSVHIETRRGGTEIASASPENTVVWSGVQATHGCSADTMCTVMAFFCSEECLNAWRGSEAAAREGHLLSLEEGLQVGKAIFTPLLAPASADERGLRGRING